MDDSTTGQIWQIFQFYLEGDSLTTAAKKQGVISFHGEISCFARSTLDSLKYIRQLKDKNIPVFFEKENINTMDSKGEVLLDYLDIVSTAGKSVFKPECEAWFAIPLPAGVYAGQLYHFLGYTKDEEKKGS